MEKKVVLIIGQGFSGRKAIAMNLQFFAEIGDVVTANAETLGADDTTQATFTELSDKLKGLGYDVLLNQRDKAEFIPSSRLSEVVGQRETFKQQAEQANIELNKLKGQTGMSDAALLQINGLITQNEELLTQLQDANVNLQIISSANDAINPKDVLPFIDMKAVKLDKQGNVVGGVTEEIARIRVEKPYLFNKVATPPAKGGFDASGAPLVSGTQKSDMNAAIRRAANGPARSFN